MKWTITRLNKFIKRGGVIRILEGGTTPTDGTTHIYRYDLRHGRNGLRGTNTIDSTNIDQLGELYWFKWSVARIRPTYYVSNYNLNLQKYEEMKADALDSKNAD